MKYDFSGNFKMLDGTDMLASDDSKPLNMGKWLANQLVSVTKGEAIRHYDMALKLYKTGKLDLERADQMILKAFVNGEFLESVSILIKAQLIEVLEKSSV
jgi:hypothetical protein